MNARLIACHCLIKVIRQKQSLSQVLDELSSDQDTGLIKAICFGVLRHYFRLSFITKQFLQKELKAKDTDIFILILIGLYQIIYLRIPNHAAVYETVNGAKLLKKSWAVPLINAVLRNYLKNEKDLLLKIELDVESFYDHPLWLIDLIKKNWQEKWRDILLANNQQAPMSLRVNLRKISVDAYLKKLSQTNIKAYPGTTSPACINLHTPCSVAELPDFLNGYCSIQDQAAQLAAFILDPKPNHRVLDVCAAPGGKTAHILELQPHVDLLAIDIDESRCEKINANLTRLGLKAEVLCADATDTKQWWHGKLFDRILLDAPCSATGVIRRHPDIKLLRRNSDIPALVTTQLLLLKSVWPLLKEGGKLLYSTCSILCEENQDIIKKFLAATTNAKEHKLTFSIGYAQTHGWQFLPAENDMDGFYYCLLEKTDRIDSN